MTDTKPPAVTNATLLQRSVWHALRESDEKAPASEPAADDAADTDGGRKAP